MSDSGIELTGWLIGAQPSNSVCRSVSKLEWESGLRGEGGPSKARRVRARSKRPGIEERSASGFANAMNT